MVNTQKTKMHVKKKKKKKKKKKGIGPASGKGKYNTAFRGVYTLQATRSKSLESENGSTLNGKIVFPLGASSFLLKQTPFQKGLHVQESKHEVTKLVSLVKLAVHLPGVFNRSQISYNTY